MPKPAIAATMVNDLLRNPPVTAKMPDPASMPVEKRISTKAASPVLPPKCPKVIIGNNAASGENAKAKTNPHQRRANSPLYPPNQLVAARNLREEPRTLLGKGKLRSASSRPPASICAAKTAKEAKSAPSTSRTIIAVMPATE